HGYFVWTPLAGIALAGLFLPVSPEGRAVPPEGGSYRRQGAISPESGSYKGQGGRESGLLWLLLTFAPPGFLRGHGRPRAGVSGSVDSWTVAGGFGQRRFVALTTVLVIGLARLGVTTGGTQARPGRLALRTVGALAVYWNVALTAEFATGLMGRQKLEPARNA